MDLKGSKTEKNLLIAFAGESQARMRYDYFAKQARKEGLQQIGELFDETAMNERSHAKRFFRFLECRDVEITATYPAGKIGNTLENLKAAAEGEKEEWTDMYPAFANVADEEGFPEIATVFRMIGKIEKAHEERFKKLYNKLEDGKVFESDEKVIWKCRVWGLLHVGNKPPQKCPACLHPQGYFEIKAENY